MLTNGSFRACIIALEVPLYYLAIQNFNLTNLEQWFLSRFLDNAKTPSVQK